MNSKIIKSIPTGVTLVAVTKTFPFSAVGQAYSAGITHFGENRIEEAEGKINQAHTHGMSGILWHMVGHVQSRKIKDAVRLFDRIDSVDSMVLLKKLNDEAAKQQKQLRVLLEFNIAHEPSKYGFIETEDHILHSMQLSHINIDGVMTMAPFVDNPEKNRPVFQALQALSKSIRARNPIIGPVVSMGTSCDYRVAIEEGATEVRLGEALFGARR